LERSSDSITRAGEHLAPFDVQLLTFYGSRSIRGVPPICNQLASRFLRRTRRSLTPCPHKRTRIVEPTSHDGDRDRSPQAVSSPCPEPARPDHARPACRTRKKG
jgi:hypothetical protein